MCRNKFGRGDPCSNNQQCLSDKCTLSLCVVDECPGPLMTEGCLSDEFCMETQEGNICRNKFGRGDPCSETQQYLWNQCILLLCVEDKCPGPLTTEGCLPNQLCMATQEGNVYRNKFGKSEPCSDNQQCLSDQCTLSLCVEDECLGPLIT